MVSIVSQATAICAAALVALLPQTSRADTSSVVAHALPTLRSNAWGFVLSRPSPFGVPPDLAAPRLPRTTDPVIAGWWPQDVGRLPLKLELKPPVSLEDDERKVDLLPGLNLPASVPPLIRYTDEATDVTLSISPGSPCTGACLKLAGSF